MSLPNALYETEKSDLDTQNIFVINPIGHYVQIDHPLDVYDASDDAMYDLVDMAHHAILRAVAHTMEMYRGKKTVTDNYIPHPSDELNDLTNYINDVNYHHPFMTRSDLPEHIRFRLTKHEVERVLRMLQLHFYHTALLAMTKELGNDELYYEASRGIWQFRQSTMDELRRRKFHRRILHDRRNFHGLVRKQARDRNIAPGTSIGGRGSNFQARCS